MFSLQNIVMTGNRIYGHPKANRILMNEHF